LKFKGEIVSSELAALIHNNIIEKANGVNPYLEVKEYCTKHALKYYEYAKNMVNTSDKRLETACKIAIAGNVMDFGPEATIDMRKELDRLFEQDFPVFDINEFEMRLSKAKNILYLADNAGETVFDKVLIEEINKPLKYAVKSKAIMNDAIRHDTKDVNFPSYVEIIENGNGIQGTVLKRCSQEFMDIYNDADMIIAKGMANFETLPDENDRSFFLLKIKCSTIADISGIKENSFVLKQGGMNWRRN
jgi:uncharacterized protein with ATP-grasp and redox domains